jgi:hypothetical protein
MERGTGPKAWSEPIVISRERRDVGGETRGILEQEAMPRIWVDQELGSRDLACEDNRVDHREGSIPVTIGHQRWGGDLASAARTSHPRSCKSG